MQTTMTGCMNTEGSFSKAELSKRERKRAKVVKLLIFGESG